MKPWRMPQELALPWAASARLLQRLIERPCPIFRSQRPQGLRLKQDLAAFYSLLTVSVDVTSQATEANLLCLALRSLVVLSQGLKEIAGATALAIWRLGSLIDVMRLMTCCGVDMKSLGAWWQLRGPRFVRNAGHEEGIEADQGAGQGIERGGVHAPVRAPQYLMTKKLASFFAMPRTVER